MHWSDIFLVPFYLFLFNLFAKRLLRKRTGNDSFYTKIFYQGYRLKIFGSLFFIFIYKFYYGGGDTISFYEAAMGSYRYFSIDMRETLSFIFSIDDQIPYDIRRHSSVYYIWRGVSSLMTIRVTSVICLLSMGSLVVTNLAFAALSYFSLFRMYLFFCEQFPLLNKQMAYAFLFAPSLVFWASGILKDTITLFLLCEAFLAFHQLFFKRRGLLRNGLVIYASLYLISLIKGYIIQVFIPALILWWILAGMKRITSPLAKGLAAPVLTILAFILISAFFNYQEDTISTYNISSLEKKASDFEMWHTYLHETQGGSGYTVSRVDFSFPGFFFAAPEAIVVTFFRPFLWEVHNTVMLISSIESLIILIFTIGTLWLVGIGGFVRAVRKEPLLVFCLVFALILGASIGMTAFNFGALVRYKIPCLPFYIAALFIIRSYSKRAMKAA